MVLVHMLSFALVSFVIGMVLGFWCGISYLTGREHAQTERWENEANK